MKIEKQLKLLPKQPLRLSVEPPLLYKFLFFFLLFFPFFFTPPAKYLQKAAHKIGDI